MTLLLALLLLGSCSGAKGNPAATTPTPLTNGQWYLFQRGTLVSVPGPTTGHVEYLPWTVQSRVAGFLQIRDTLYVAVNGWGVLALPDPNGPLSSIIPFEAPRLFEGRTINGIYDDGGDVLVHLYRNTLFAAPQPQTPPITAVRLDLPGGRLEPIALRSSREGWEAVDVVHDEDSHWVIAWKKNDAKQVQFKYRAISPRTDVERTLSRSEFLHAYGFTDISTAPLPVRAIATAIEAQYSNHPVIHLLVRTPGYTRIVRFRLGSEALLASGDASLVTAPVVETSTGYFALLGNGSLFVAPKAEGDSYPTRFSLPALSRGFAYTDLWVEGRTAVVSWEQQRFTQVAAAGVYVVQFAHGG